MSAIAVIPARGGSRRIPRKNIRLFHGKPIIAYSIEAAKACGLFSEIVVSTDDGDIADIAHANGCSVHRRSAEDARDEVGTQEVVRAVLEVHFPHPLPEHACCIYATAPMLSHLTLKLAYDYLRYGHVDYVVPMAAWPRDPGQFYFGTTFAFLSRSPLVSATRVMAINPATECDINTEDDWLRAEQMYTTLVVNNALLKIGALQEAK